jgi:LAO/AO transport system kinase
MALATALSTAVLAGDRRAAARLLRAIDDNLPGADEALRELYPKTGRAQLVGVTGTPGAGKSTLCDRLIAHWRREGKRVGVLAVDPTSPFTGGAILGDRIRMQEHALDKGVFIRSLATRGNLGGLSRATFDSARVLDALGCDVVLIETVGVGQDEVEIAQLAHTTILVTLPGLGDDVQAIKAGVLEIADVFVVNKADREGADRSIRDLRMMLELRRTSPLFHATEWEPPIVSCIATQDHGVDTLVSAIARHWAQLDQTGERMKREAARARTDLLQRLQARLLGRALQSLETASESLEVLAERIAKRELDPYAAAERISRAVLAPEGP